MHTTQKSKLYQQKWNKDEIFKGTVTVIQFTKKKKKKKKKFIQMWKGEILKAL